MMQWYKRASIARDIHLGLRTNRLPLADAKFIVLYYPFLIAVTRPIEEEHVEGLIKANNDKLLDSFKGLLEQTVSQIKRSNEESAESQMKEVQRAS